MKKVFKKIKNIFIIYVVFYLFLGTATSCFAVSYSSSAGEYVSEYAREFIETYGSTAVYDNSSAYPSWKNGVFYCCCTTGVYYMYYEALGINIYDYGFSATAYTNLTSLEGSGYWEKVSLSDTEPGDILVKTKTSGETGHVEMVISAGNTEHANFGSTSSGGACKIHSSCNNSMVAYRLSSSVEVYPSGTVSGTTSSSSYTFSDFYFNGIPDGTYSLASSNIWTTLVETLASIADYLIGILTYIIRAVVVGWTSIIDRLFNWTVNTVTNTDTESEDMGISGADVDETDSSERITLESIFYGEYDLLDINIFD